MYLSSRVKESQASITLKVNEKINRMIQDGKYVYNMTNGQLPFKPSSEFKDELARQLNFLKSYQYSSISGFKELRKKFLDYKQKKREIEGKISGHSCIISNGSKHSLYNALGTIIDPGDEVILLAPYWVSYPEMIKFWGGVPHVVSSHGFDAYTPYVDEIEKAISSKTKAIIINSPNNPAGIHYTEKWMQSFADLVVKHENLLVISDEVYSDIAYFDPAPKYFYQYRPEVLERTLIVDGISKSLAATGLRIGYCIADKKIIKGMSKIQSQTTSGPNSLIQRALIEYNFDNLEKFCDPIKMQLRESTRLVSEAFRAVGLDHCFYQTTSAFYYLLDFSRMPMFEKFDNREKEDHSTEIVNDILEKTGVALVPGSSFGQKNSARMSLTLEKAPFAEGITKLADYLTRK